MIKIAPSILASDFGALRNDVIAIEKAGADWAHIDIMDGHFVPNLSMGPDIVKAIRGESGLFFDCHLMVTDPKMFVEPFVKAGAELITFHAECVEDMDSLIDYIHSFGVKAAVAIKPATSEEVLFPVLHKLDMVLVMSVVPGFGGQKFMPEVLDKVRNIRAHEHGKNIDIQMDAVNRDIYWLETASPIKKPDDINILDISQTIVKEYFNMLMIIDGSKMDVSFDEMVNSLDEIGEELGMSIKCQREEIFTKMHRI